MLTNVVKRNGSLMTFDSSKIYRAIEKAFIAVNNSQEGAETVFQRVMGQLDIIGIEKNQVLIEEIQDIVEHTFFEFPQYRDVAIAYIKYRNEHKIARDIYKNMMEEAAKICKETDKLNANIINGPMSKMLQMGALMAKSFVKSEYSAIPKEFSLAHSNGDIHIHDMDFMLFTVNCLQIPVKRLLKEGFNTGHGFTRPAKRLQVAVDHVAILLQDCQNDMFGGQSVPSFDEALAEFGEKATDEEIFQCMAGLIAKLNSMHSRAGAQVPFTSLNIGLDTTDGGRKITKGLLLAYEKGLGKGENPIFPNILFKVRRGVNRFPEDPNYDLFKLAMRVTARRMNPTYIFMDTTFNSPYKSVDYMGCRTRVISNVNGEETSEARGNLFFVTINLPRLGILANHNVDTFFKLLDEKLDLCERQLMNRYQYVIDNIKVKDMPFVMGEHLYMGSEGLKPEDSVEKAVRQGTMSVGFIGLAETLVALIGKHHGESEEANALGLKIVSHMREAMDKMTERTHLNFSLFATPAEGLSGRFTNIDKKRFGEIKGVTDREYYTNSFHVPVYYDTTHYHKMQVEGQYHKYCNAGHISYVEFSAPPINNLDAVEKELNHMADSDVGYAGINFPIDFCGDCHYQGVINEDVCPICGSHDIHRIRRVTGYFSEIQNMNDGKRGEVRDRIPMKIK